MLGGMKNRDPCGLMESQVTASLAGPEAQLVGNTDPL